MANIKHLFPGANTPQGFRSLYREALRGTEKIYILKGGPGVGKSTLMRKLGLELANCGFDCELWQCSSDSASLDGVVCRELRIAVIDGTAPHTLDPDYPGVREEIINLGAYWDGQALQAHGAEIIGLFSEISALFAEGYDCLRRAEDKRRLLLEAGAAPYDRKLADSLLEKVFRAEAPRRAFASAVTDSGIVNYAESISAACRRRFILQGRQNTLGAALLADVGREARSKGLLTEEYYSPFETEKMEILLLPQLDTALIDASEPHVRLKPRPGDERIELTPPLPVSVNGHESEYRNAFESELEKCVACFQAAKTKHDRLESYYIQAMDFDAVNARGKELIDGILRLISKEKA